MKILFLTDNFPPEVNAPANRTYEHAIEWVKKGAEVWIITSFPNFPIGKVFDGYKNKYYQYEKIDGINVIRVWTFIAENKGFLLRIIDYISYMISSILISYKVKAPDIVIATSPQFFTAIAGLIVSKIKQKPFILEIRDLWPESIKAVGAMKDNIIIRILEHIETYLYNNATAIIVVIEAFKNHIKKHSNNKHIYLIPNGVNRTKFYPREKDEKLLKQINPNKHLLISYIGTIGMAHDLDTILDVIKEKSDVKLLIIGDGANRDHIKERIEKEKITNAILLPLIQHNEIPVYWNISDIAFVPLKKSKLFENALPSKIPEAAGMGKPMIISVDGFAQRLIEKYDCGIYGGVENKQLLKRAIEQMQDPETRKRFSANALNLANDYSRERFAIKFLNILKKITNK